MTGFDEEAPEEDREPMLGSIVPGSVADKTLREAMKTLRENAPDDESRQLFTDILQGRRSARDLVDSEAFAAMAQDGTRRYEEQLANMTEEERAQFEQRAAQVDLDAPADDTPS